MRIYCIYCKDYILETSDQFQPGGEYHGGMFKPAILDRWKATTFNCREHIKRGDMYCPRCMGSFIGHKGELLTEHGIVYAGQDSIDTEFSVLLPDGRIGHALPSKEVPKIDRIAFAAAERQAIIDHMEEQGEQILTHLKDTLSDALFNEDGYVRCQKCGKQYKDTEAGLRWYEKHIKECGQ
jgi:hypothetical protein